jgi:membrane-bound metal-dependent hydrolase YbcI (DUF457 family)
MALSIAHAAAGYLVYEAARPSGPHRPGLLVGAVVLANAADLDFVPGLVAGDPDLWHRGFTHTLGAALLVTIVAALVARVVRGGRWPAVGRLAAFVGAAYGSHLLLDYVSADVVAPHGARFLWPFSDAYYLAPAPLLGEIIIDRTGRLAFFQSLLSRTAITRWGTELGLLAGAIVLVHGLRFWRAMLASPVGAVGEES